MNTVNEHKLLVDVGGGRKVENCLVESGFDVLSIRDIDIRMPDIKILELAVLEKRIIVTMDKDFGELVYKSGNNHYGVLLLRLEDEAGNKKVAVIQEIIKLGFDKIRGHFCVYNDKRLRIRK